MQRRRPGFLRTGQNEIESVEFATLCSEHPHQSKAADRFTQSGRSQFKEAAALALSIFL
jgi:hypothetical protein